MKHIKRLGKKLKTSPILLVLLIVGSLIVGATVLNYLFQTQTAVTTENLFDFDDTPAEETLITRTINNAVGGNVYEFTHYLNASANIQDFVTIDFEFTGNTTDGITAELLYLGSPITSLDIYADTDYCVIEKYTLDTMIEPGETYNIVLTATAT